MKPLSVVALAVLTMVSIATVPRATGATAGTTEVTVVLVCDGREGEEGERLLVTELMMALEGLRQVPELPGAVPVSALSLDDQVLMIRRAAGDGARGPILWSRCDQDPPYTVRVMTEAEGGDSVRILTASSPEEIALVVKELVEAPPVSPDPPEDPPAAEAPPPPSRPEGTLALYGAVAPGGMPGVGFVIRGGAALEAGFEGGFLLRAGVNGARGPTVRDRDMLFSARGLELGLGLGYSWSLGRFRLAPVVTGYLTRWMSDYNVDNSYNQKHDWWGGRVSAAVDLRLALSERVFAVLAPTLGLATTRRFYRQSDGETLVDLPVIDLSCALGLLVML